MAKNTHDVIVIGAGHNGLTAASYMAKAGLDVVVLEKNEWIGGAAVSRELYPGWKYSNCSYVCSLLRPEIMRDLELYKYGLQIIPYEGSATMMRNGDYYAHYHDHDMTINSIRRHSHKDAEAYERYSRDVLRQCKIIKPLLKMTPPDLTSFKPKDLFGALEFAKHFAAKDELGGLGEKEIYDTIRFYTMSIRDYLDEYFESDITKAHLAGSAIIGTALGPCSPGSAYVLLHHYMGEVDGSVGAWGYSRGGMGSITKAMTGCLNAHGGEVKPDNEVVNVITKNGRAIGVATKKGDEYYAKKIVSNLDVKRTFLKITEESSLPGEFVERVKNFKIRGSSGKLNIALDGLPEFPCIPEGDPGGGGDMHFTETIEEMEGAVLLIVYGGKITTYRKLAEKAVSKITALLNLKRKEWTATKHLPGGGFKLEDKEKLIVGILKKYKFLNRNWAERLFKTFGTDVEKVLGKAKAKKDLGRNFGSDLTEREVLWYINKEHARCVEDLIWRRSKLGLRLSSKQIRELSSYIKKLN